MTITVLLADDHAMFRSGLRAVLDTQPDLICVAEAGDGAAAVEQARVHRPDVAVLDVRMPRMDGLAATEEIVANNHTKVLVLTTYDLDEYLYRALRVGASGFLLKSLPPEEMVSAIKVAARGDALIDPSVTRRLAARFTDSIRPTDAGHDRLTSREREVLLLVAEALSNAEIAERLTIGEETVKTHVSRVLAKLDLRDRVHAVVYAHRHGLVP
ncbi:response regulator [Actinokineospora diospyrosa]|uniref:DNA-binding response regulator, NarL/FixJ family, contains REC and HTH domains n=1 Tax=Actinokineospora diospyrosa TaxID=103728 RepID=A0ABT1IF39_9PSEU|nr:response regulator transcription factor [Actinokineospora diospyrosa]MCP2271268.1 DNA-binding response regulator, NarL/FixJ family, contains REC and HTH domains [Actinokineospora diospyrosa]